MSTNKEVRRGRPQLHPLTGTQVNSIRKRIDKGESVAKIAAALNVHDYAVLRVKRGSAN